MARITSISKVAKERQSVHDPVECGYSTFSEGSRRYLQLETYGSSERQFQGKTSQAIQLDEAGARRLLEIIKEAFPTLR